MSEPAFTCAHGWKKCAECYPEARMQHARERAGFTKVVESTAAFIKELNDANDTLRSALKQCREALEECEPMCLFSDRTCARSLRDRLDWCAECCRRADSYEPALAKISEVLGDE